MYRKMNLALVFAALIAASVQAQVALDGATVGVIDGGRELTEITLPGVDYTIGDNVDRLLVVSIALETRNAAVASVTYGGADLMQAITDGGGGWFSNYADIWYLTNPDVGAGKDIVVTYSDVVFNGSVVAVTSLYNVNQDTPLGETSSAFAEADT